MVLLSDVVYYIIWLDAIGACLVVIWMIVWFLHNDGRYEPHHWTMWVAQEDRENTAMSRFARNYSGRRAGVRRCVLEER